MTNIQLTKDHLDMLEDVRNAHARETRARHAAEQICKRQAEILDQALTAMAEAQNLHDLISTVLRANALELKADGLSFWRYDPVRDKIALQMMFAYGEFYTDSMLNRVGVPREISKSDAPTWFEIQKTDQPFAIYDIASDTRVTHKPQILAQGVKTMLVVPLMSNHKPIGWSSTFHLENRVYGDDYIRLAQALAQQATLVVELISLAERGRAAARKTLKPLEEPLTSRELEVLRLWSEDESDQTVADKLVIKVSTVKAHGTNIRRKLGVKRRGQAVSEARKRGILN